MEEFGEMNNIKEVGFFCCLFSALACIETAQYSYDNNDMHKCVFYSFLSALLILPVIVTLYKIMI